uniref:protein-tyrosine-phosphatase n=1 Tax=Leptobrachium leishanense TaxID=445787 RepID=A0A8C5PCA2_9ANUR
MLMWLFWPDVCGHGLFNTVLCFGIFPQGYNATKEFIASQGPLPNTNADFWRMIWEHRVNTIVMLTNCMENGRRVKLDKLNILFWPLYVKQVRHFHFTVWPDHGVPENTNDIIQFRSLVREHMDQQKSNGPAVVHCSAGVGRTGTLIALDYLIQQMEKENRISAYGIVEKMRMNRPLMVQTEVKMHTLMLGESFIFDPLH